MDGCTPLEKGFEKLNRTVAAYKLPFLTCMIVGLLAYCFVFTNKLLNLDEIAGLFQKGESISSGRWGLWLSQYLFPNVSMPWINGILSLLMLSVAACLVIGLFEIRTGWLQMLLAALLIVFPSQIITFSYMFTCAPYALALLLAVASVALFLWEDKRYKPLSFLLLACSLGIYQAYIAYAATLYLVYIIKMLLDENASPSLVLRRGFSCVGALLAGLLVYALINQAVMRISGTQYNSYADASMQNDAASVLFGLRVAYTAFVGYITKGHYHLAATGVSQLLHGLCVLIIGYELLYFFIKKAGKGQRMLLLLCLLLLPLAVNCLYVVSSLRHSLMLYSFSGVYVLSAVCMERLMRDRDLLFRDVLAVSMALIVACNVVYANKLYLKLKLDYENAYGFYQGLVTRIKAAEGFTEDTMVVITGEAHNLLYENREIDTSDLVGIMEGLINVYSRSNFISYYIGFTPTPIDWDAWSEVGGNELIESMPEYPYDGSIQKAGDYLIVKLG